MKKFIIVIMAAVFGYTAHTQTANDNYPYKQVILKTGDTMSLRFITKDTALNIKITAEDTTQILLEENKTLIILTTDDTARREVHLLLRASDTSKIVVLPEDLWGASKKVITKLMNHEPVTVSGREGNINSFSTDDFMTHIFYKRTFVFTGSEIQKITEIDWTKIIICNLIALMVIIMSFLVGLDENKELTVKAARKIILYLIIIAVISSIFVPGMISRFWESVLHFI